jgi:hypothetical protein
VHSSLLGSDTNLCLTRHIFRDLHECQAANCLSCPHLVLFSNTKYCRHPDRRRFPSVTPSEETPHDLHSAVSEA